MREKPYNAFIKLKHTEITDLISFVFMFMDLFISFSHVYKNCIMTPLNVCLFQEHFIF